MALKKNRIVFKDQEQNGFESPNNPGRLLIPCLETHDGKLYELPHIVALEIEEDTESGRIKCFAKIKSYILETAKWAKEFNKPPNKLKIKYELPRGVIVTDKEID